MSEQRIPFEIREEAKNGLSDWWKDRLDSWFFNQVSGNTTQTDQRYTGLQATVAPDVNHFVTAGGLAASANSAFGKVVATAEASLSNTTTMSLSYADIDRAVAQAKTLTPMIRPIRIEGEDHYALFLHPNQVLALRKNGSSSGQFIDIQKAAMTGGKIKDNPIFNGSLGVYNNVILYEAVRLPTVVTTPTGEASASLSNYRRAVLCGAQAAVIGFGRGNDNMAMDWNEELFDYGNQLGVEVGMIGGLKKTVFNSADFATIVVASYAPTP